MTEEQILKSFNCLISKLDFAQSNTTLNREFRRKCRSLIISDNQSKKNDLISLIRSSVESIYKEHREDIMSKDFSFLTENVLVIETVDIGVLYINALDEDDEEALKLVNNELLFLFYQVAPSDDKKEIDKIYKKAAPKVEPTKSVPQGVQPNLAKQMERMLQKNKHKLKKAETDPNVIPEVLADFFKNNSNDMAGMLTGMLGTMGIDPAQMNNGK